MRVVIVGMYAPYPGPFDGVEVWGCNYTYRRQTNLSRLYAMDPIHRFHKMFVQDVDALGIPVVLQDRIDEIALSETYPLDEVLQATLGTDDRTRAYFTSTISYMLADAIRAGAEEVTIHRVLVLPPSIEYFRQKACLDFWVGLMLGRGIKVRISEDSNIGRPLPWDTGLYGYEFATSEHANGIMISAARAAARLPIEFAPGREDTKPPFEHVEA